MRILVIGGTRFVGRAIVEEAVKRGHEVDVFHRGSTPLQGSNLQGSRVNEIIGDRDSDMSGLASGQWDATVDVCAYRPHQVEELAQALGGRGGHHTFISTVSYYADDIPAGSDESAPAKDTSVLDGMDVRTCPIDGNTYGALKVLCEEAARAAYSSLLMIRPTYVLGPDDYTMRYPKWVELISKGGKIECPYSDGVPMQYIDARDQAIFVVDQIEKKTSATFHCAAPSISFRDLLEQTVAAIGPSGTELHYLDMETSEKKSEEFPLWGGSTDVGTLQMDPSAALRAGMPVRPFAETARDTLQWLKTKS